MEHEEEESLTKFEMAFPQAFLHMKAMVEEFYKEKRKNGEGQSQVKYEGVSGDPHQILPPPPPPPPPLPPSTSHKGKLKNAFVKVGCEI